MISQTQYLWSNSISKEHTLYRDTVLSQKEYYEKMSSHHSVKRQKVKHCIFCSSDSKLSKEHIFPDWLKDFLPRDMQQHTFKHQIFYPNGVKSREQNITGDPKSRKLPVVCEKCNNGWMSRLQEETKPILLPLIQGNKTRLRAKSQMQLAQWCTMAVMVAEFVLPKLIAIPQPSRTYFKETLLPPDNWKIWIGNFQRDKWPGYLCHNVLPVFGESQSMVVNHCGVCPPNTHETTYVVGNLFIYAFSSTQINVVKNWWPEGENRIIHRIFPQDRAVIRWPCPVMNDREADVITNSFFNAVGR